MVERGLKQSEQIKENPLTQNFVIGKRGRPPNPLKAGQANKKKKKDHGTEETITEKEPVEAPSMTKLQEDLVEMTQTKPL